MLNRFWAILFLFVLSSPAEGNVIRDAEIEDILKTWASPLAEAGSVDFNSVHLVILNDKTINAFVTEGRHLFVHSGLLTATRNSDEVKGVLAHELGHIAGGHLLRLQDALDDSSIWGVFTMLLGAAALAAGQVDVGLAGLMALPNVGNRLLLDEVRQNETLADQAAISYLRQTGQSVRGLYSFLGQLASTEPTGDVDPYQLTHPLSAERLRLVEEYLRKEQPHCCNHETDEWRYARMHAKLMAFLESPAKVQSYYASAPSSFASHYAHAILRHRAGDLSGALYLIDGLMQNYGEDAYLQELRGQFLFEHGRTDDAVLSYARAVELSDNHPLILLGWSQAALALEDTSILPSVLLALAKVLQAEKENAMAWHFYSVAAGRNGDIGLAEVALAERSLIIGDTKQALRHVNRAMEWLEQDSPHRQRAQDILLILSES